MNEGIKITAQYYAETPAFYFDKEAVADIIINRNLDGTQKWKYGARSSNSVISYRSSALQHYSQSMGYVASHKEISKIARHLRIPFINHALFFDIPPMSRVPIHVDRIYSINPDKYSLNIPVKNTSMTVMNWWKHDKPVAAKSDEVTFTKTQVYKDEKDPSNITTSPIIPFEECTLINSCSMDKPHFVKVDDWHNVDNNHPTERSYFLALRFDEKLDEQDIRKLLKI